jgi:hypothetical protein|tara:strand:- start:158 stop:526 length:369 start_codon:yes stop_codon:yes gene_type:complete
MEDLGLTGQDLSLLTELFKQIGAKGVGVLLFVGVCFRLGTQYLQFKREKEGIESTSEIKEETELVTEILNLNEVRDDDQQKRIEKLEIELDALKEGFNLLSLKFLDFVDVAENDDKEKDADQ